MNEAGFSKETIDIIAEQKFKGAGFSQLTEERIEKMGVKPYGEVMDLIAFIQKHK